MTYKRMQCTDCRVEGRTNAGLFVRTMRVDPDTKEEFECLTAGTPGWVTAHGEAFCVVHALERGAREHTLKGKKT